MERGRQPGHSVAGYGSAYRYSRPFSPSQTQTLEPLEPSGPTSEPPVLPSVLPSLVVSLVELEGCVQAVIKRSGTSVLVQTDEMSSCRV